VGRRPDRPQSKVDAKETSVTESSTATEFPYIHGFSPTEQARLVKQARIAEQTIFRNIDFDGSRRILEVGCGVGAQTEIPICTSPGWT
jgi:2-polyprenyl-3-methyl-5-hydroxy-6-metoxy-1,4-benzoquinol methylase